MAGDYPQRSPIVGLFYLVGVAFLCLQVQVAGSAIFLMPTPEVTNRQPTYIFQKLCYIVVNVRNCRRGMVSVIYGLCWFHGIYGNDKFPTNHMDR